MPLVQACSVCGFPFPATSAYFGVSARNLTGLSTRCLGCRAAADARYGKRKRDRQSDRAKAAAAKVAKRTTSSDYHSVPDDSAYRAGVEARIAEVRAAKERIFGEK